GADASPRRATAWPAHCAAPATAPAAPHSKERCAAARSTRACHSSALHSWQLMRETWNCMANLLANVVSVSLAAAPPALRQARAKTPEPACPRHRALLRPHAYRPRRGRATEKGTRDVSIDRIAFGPPPARAGLQVTQNYQGQQRVAK